MKSLVSSAVLKVLSEENETSNPYTVTQNKLNRTGNKQGNPLIRHWVESTHIHLSRDTGL